MSVVTEKQLAEVQAQYDEIRASWVNPQQHSSIQQQLQREQQTKQTFEVEFPCIKYYYIMFKLYFGS